MKVVKKYECIDLPAVKKQEIANILGCHINTVNCALNNVTQGEQPDLIRKMAMERGAVKTYKTKLVDDGR